MIPTFFPRHLYWCVLDEQPDHLSPSSVPLTEARELVVNPDCWLGWHGSLPPAVTAAAGSTDGLYVNPWIIWVHDPDRGTLWPYWLGPRYAHLLQDLVPGLPPSELPADVVTNLRMAGILVPPDDAARRRHLWLAVVDAHRAWPKRGWLQLDRVLPAAHVGALRRYYRFHTRMGTFALGDDQVPGRYAAYDEPTTAFVHRQLTRMVSDLAHRVLVASYNYLALYQGGAWLDVHTDRDACEYTLSVCIDATPDPLTFGGWPLNLAGPEGAVSVTLGLGDGLLFLGRTLAHWRDTLPQGYTSSSALFHFVTAS